MRVWKVYLLLVVVVILLPLLSCSSSPPSGSATIPGIQSSITELSGKMDRYVGDQANYNDEIRQLREQVESIQTKLNEIESLLR